MSAPGTSAATPRFLATAEAWRAWLGRHHADTAELWVGLRRKGGAVPGLTYAEALDGALCFGWIDGVRKAFDTTGFVQRFTPRKARSVWSDVNTKRYRQLLRAGLVAAPGRAAFARRTAERAGLYSFEQPAVAMPAAYARELKADRAAWTFFSSRPAGYRRTATWWVISAKQEATRLRRLATLIDDSAHGRLIAPLRRAPRRKDAAR